MLGKLKAAVGAIFDKYFSSEIDEQDAIKQVKALGLEITVDVPTKLTDRRCARTRPAPGGHSHQLAGARREPAAGATHSHA
jgi:hypothetical protein